MKKYFLSLLLIPQFVLSQQIKVLYSRTFDLPDAKYLKKYTPAAIEHLKKKSYDYLLKNNETSLYFPAEQNEDFFDTDTTRISDKKENIRKVTISSNTASVVYFNLIDNYYIKKATIRNEVYFVKDKLPEFKWKILPQKKKIKNFMVQKAITDYNGNKITAWFAEDIPVKPGQEYLEDCPV